MRIEPPVTEGSEGGKEPHRCGTATLAGRTNVGKSTLLNALLGAKIAIATPKPQTTRLRIAGIRTCPGVQTIWLDAPGFHRLPRGRRGREGLNRRLLRTARDTIAEADVAVLVIDAADGLTRPDRQLADELSARGGPWILAPNKIDRLGRDRLIPFLDELGRTFGDREIVPVSGRTGENLPELERTVAALLPQGPARHGADELTDQTARRLVEEFVREQIYLQTEQEVPYDTAVLVERYEEASDRPVVVVAATILVEREAQRRILIGRGGAMIGEIGRAARLELERFFEKRFHLDLHVKAKPRWASDPETLRDLGLE